MRADAKENHGHLLAAARDVVAEQGVQASLRDIARKAQVSHVTLLRHFPTRQALLDALLRQSLEELTAKADKLQTSTSPGEALLSWLRDAVGFVVVYSGGVTMMATALADPGSALHASCESLRLAGERLLRGAQAEGTARSDMEGSDLFALIGALGWIGDQQSFKPRADYLFDVVADAILTSRSTRPPRS